MARVQELGFKSEEISVRYGMDMRYLGQAHEVRLEIPGRLARKVGVSTLAELVGLFHERHHELFGHSSPDAEVEFITLWTTAIGPMAKTAMREIAEGTSDGRRAYKKDRRAYYAELGGYVDCPTYERSLLGANDAITGPAIVEQMDTTIVLPPGQTGSVDRFGNMMVRVSVPEETPLP